MGPKTQIFDPMLFAEKLPCPLNWLRNIDIITLNSVHIGGL